MHVPLKYSKSPSEKAELRVAHRNTGKFGTLGISGNDERIDRYLGRKVTTYPRSKRLDNRETRDARESLASGSERENEPARRGRVGLIVEGCDRVAGKTEGSPGLVLIGAVKVGAVRAKPGERI